jgi:hypothetical protein
MTKEMTTLEKLEEGTKKQVEEMVSNLFQKHRTAVGNRKLTINMIEDMLIEARDETERILKSSMSAMVKVNEEDLIKKKKFVHTAAES